jgi:hypothetical protein
MSITLALLLAEDVSFTDMGRNFRDGGAGLTPAYIAFGLAVLIGFVLSVWLVSRRMKYRDEHGYNSPRALLQELCRTHGLDRADRRALKALARRRRLDQPSRLFLEPDRFEIGEEVAISGEERRRLERLRDRIFGRQLEVGRKPAAS